MGNINIDSTQAIMDATQYHRDKWQFVYDGEVVAEATAPTKATAEIIEEWCAAVRGRIRARTEIDEAEIIARKKRRRESDGVPIDSGTTDNSNTTGGRIDDAVDADTGHSGRMDSFNEDPELYALEQVKRLSERQTTLEEELKEVIRSRRKWDAIAAAAQQAGDEDV
jgi:hypothetical protein